GAADLATFENSHGIKSLFVQKTVRRPTFVAGSGGYSHVGDSHVREWRIKKVAVARRGDCSKGGKIAFQNDMDAAAAMGDGRFATPMNFDTRGRVYALPGFNFAREDHIRALFDFDQGKEIGRDGLRWLKVHVCNCSAGFNSSRPASMTFEKRVAW